MKFTPVAAVVLVALFNPFLVYSEEENPGIVETGIDRSNLPVRVEDFDGVQNGVYRDGRLYIAGQPNEAALQRFKDHGVTAVVKLRTPPEMDNRERVPFDEAAAVAALGLEYVHIPLGGEDHPYDRSAVDAFAAVHEEHRGAVLLHCTVAWRASISGRPISSSITTIPLTTPWNAARRSPSAPLRSRACSDSRSP